MVWQGQAAGLLEALGIASFPRTQRAALPAIGVFSGDKITRVFLQLEKFANGQVFFPREAPWLVDLEHELFSFRTGALMTRLMLIQALADKRPKPFGMRPPLRDGAPFHGRIGPVQRAERPLMSNLLCGRKPTDPHRLCYPRLKMAAAVPRLANCRQLASKSDSLLSDLSERARPLLRRLILWGE